MPNYLSKFYDTEDARENFDAEFSKEDCIKSTVEELLRDITFIPDAFRVLESEGEIQLFEIEDSHPLTIEKLKLLASTWVAFDEVGLNLRLFISDRYGASIIELDLDLYEQLLWQ